MKRLLLLVLLVVASAGSAQTPTLNVRTAHNGLAEERCKQQIERLAQQYDLSKYTLTRDIIVDRTAANHSYPVLTLNPRFLDDDDLALSAYVHEQGHWVLMERHRQHMQPLFADLQRIVRNMEYQKPQGDGTLRSSYYHLVVIMLEWRAMEDLVGQERALRVMKWKQKDHYTAIYTAVLEHREEIQKIMDRYYIRWDK
jgi:hypothetical protein